MTSNRVLAIAAATSLGLLVGGARATTYYVSPGGNDGANGTTLTTTFATIGKAVGAASAGDTIYVRAGTYALASTLSLAKNGTAAAPFTLAAYNNEAATLDFTTQAAGQRGVQLNGNYWTVRGLTVANAKDNGILIAGSYNTIDRVVTRNNQDSGLQISANGSLKPSYNTIRNVDSYANYDPAAHGENADGFAAKFRGLGVGNVFDGCRAWGNSDDGWDMWGAESGVVVKNSWSFKNGFNTFGDANWAGDGNGIKLGHDSGTHTLTNNVFWGNRLNGVDVNGNAGDDVGPTKIAHGVTVENNTAWNNGAGGNGHNFYFDEAFAHVLKNNLAVAGGSGNASVMAGVIDDHNSWNGFNATAADFLSISDAIATGPRLADGSLPTSDFLHLKPTSALVNAGTNVGLAYSGSAPDLGAFEVTPAPEPTTVPALLGSAALLWRGARRAK